MSNTKKKGIIFGATDEVGAHIAYEISKKGGDIILQGNLDPNIINRGGSELEDAVNKLLLSTKDRNHIYCSGHGLLPSTPIKNVERVIQMIKN